MSLIEKPGPVSVEKAEVVACEAPQCSGDTDMSILSENETKEKVDSKVKAGFQPTTFWTLFENNKTDKSDSIDLSDDSPIPRFDNTSGSVEIKTEVLPPERKYKSIRRCILGRDATNAIDLDRDVPSSQSDPHSGALDKQREFLADIINKARSSRTRASIQEGVSVDEDLIGLPASPPPSDDSALVEQWLQESSASSPTAKRLADPGHEQAPKEAKRTRIWNRARKEDELDEIDFSSNLLQDAETLHHRPAMMESEETVAEEVIARWIRDAPDKYRQEALRSAKALKSAKKVFGSAKKQIKLVHGFKWLIKGEVFVSAIEHKLRRI